MRRRAAFRSKQTNIGALELESQIKSEEWLNNELKLDLMSGTLGPRGSTCLRTFAVHHWWW